MNQKIQQTTALCKKHPFDFAQGDIPLLKECQSERSRGLQGDIPLLKECQSERSRGLSGTGSSNFRRGLFMVMLVLTATGLWAQPGGGGGGQGGGGPPPGSTGAPIDSGAVGLLLSAAGYAYYQLGLRKKNNI